MPVVKVQENGLVIATPSGAVDAADTSPVNLGLKFQASASGFITGIRFYKETDNTGTHVGSLWSSSGALLATGTFSNETASGWQELDFTSPVAVTAGTTYVASYHTNAGHYALTGTRTLPWLADAAAGIAGAGGAAALLQAVSPATAAPAAARMMRFKTCSVRGWVL